MDSIARMKELALILSEASKAYYAEDKEIMSNYEYDRLYDELCDLEEQTGVVLAGSPTQSVGYEAVKELPKVRHELPMLSLGKTKDREELRNWVGDREAIMSWKLDGLTVVVTYRDGKLVQALTRGNGEVGEEITNNAKTFINIPLQIPYQGELIVRGEAVISYPDFEKINSEIDDTEAKYKNPRNLCSGSVRQLSNEITAARNVRLIVYTLVRADGVDFEDSVEKQLLFLKNQGFEIVEYKRVSSENILDALSYFETKVKTYELPSDGLVLWLDEIEYGKSLGMTAKFPRNGIAFKWADEVAETTLREMEWSPSRTGLINPVAIFDPVELEGTTVTRASVHNVSIMRGLKLGIGDRITVYKANMIIPQIAENLTGKDDLELPESCPACGCPTCLKQENDVQYLYCLNPECAAKKIKSFDHFVSRDALNIDGLSEATLEKLIAKGWIHTYLDLFHLEKHRDEFVLMEGFGQKSFDNLLESIRASRTVTLPKLLYSLGIPGVGLATAKLICRHYQDDTEAILHADEEELAMIDQVGPVIAGAVVSYFADENRLNVFRLLLDEVKVDRAEYSDEPGGLDGLIFVITGSLIHYENRDALKEIIESKGGKVTGSVTGKTTALINNDITSNSSKNKKAKDLGVRIISEDDFRKEYLGE